jgi:anti-sigma B factor antagonist
VTVATTAVGGEACEHAPFVSSREGDATLVTVVGDVDFVCAGAFAAALAAVADEGFAAIVDMSGVVFIDTAAVDAIDRVRRLFEILGLAFVIRAPSRPVRRLLGLSHLDRLIEQPEATVSQMFGPTRPAPAGFGTRVGFGP